MAQPVLTSGQSDWLRPHLRWITVPSWMLSAGFHAVLWSALLVISRMPGCQPDMSGDAAEELREVGLSIRPASSPVPLDSPEESDVPQTALAEVSPAATAPEIVPDRPPVELQLPKLDAPAVIGAGGPPRSVASTDQILSAQRPAGGGGANSGAAGSANSTSFLGIEDAGKRFVYLIDCSSSMANHEALRVAKTELMASLERLNEAQQFQVIFANTEQVRTLNAGRAGIFYGTDPQRLEVRLQMASIQPDGGTNHTHALEAALEFNPDVLFYLTDGREPAMSPGDLARIKQRNRGTRIHTIEFGSAALPVDANGNPPPSFLTKLASQNDGRSTYRDLSRFAGN